MKNRIPDVSVIMPTFRRSELLASAIESVLAQTFTDLELIVVDDDPAGSAGGVVGKFQDDRILYVRHDETRGGSAARNTGLARSRGRLVAFLDDDDLWHKDFLEKMIVAMGRCSAQVGVLHCAVELVGRDGGRTISQPHAALRGDVHAAMLRGEKAGGIVSLVRREVFDRCGGFDEELPSAQDWDMWIRASRQFHFEHIADVLAIVRDYGERISSDISRAILSRAKIIEKYAADFDRDPASRRARGIHLKRLGKLNMQAGHWSEAWRWFVRAAEGRPWEWAKILAWLVVQWRPSCLFIAIFMSLGIAAYSQAGVFRSGYIVNDDVCQHLWWMRSFTDPGLFQNDLLREYAFSLQHIGILALYWGTVWVMDPLVVAKILPFILFPLAIWAVYRLVRVLTRNDYTALLCSVSFMVTPFYLQHMTGGHAHVFGYPLLLLFLYFLMARAYRAMAYVMIAAVFFFPVVFALGGAIWLIAWMFRREKGKVLLMTAVAGLTVLVVKFMVFTPASIGHVLSRADVARMPELTSAGRWALWPVESFGQALIRFMENGTFLFRGMYKTFLPWAWKEVFLAQHVLLAVLTLMAGAWWWRQRKAISCGLIGWVVAASAVLYGVAAQIMLQLYAPDRYASYTLAVAGLLFIMIPVGMTVSAWPVPRWRGVLKVMVLLSVLSFVPLVKGAGLKDYGQHKDLYIFLSKLPRNALIAAWPDTADAIPLFSKRSVLVNEELSVPLFDRYWETVKARTYDLLGAYYASDAGTVASFCRRHGVTHLVVEHHRFSPEFLSGRVYFEPFGSWARERFKAGQVFYLNEVPRKDCVWAQGDLCVMDVSTLK